MTWDLLCVKMDNKIFGKKDFESLFNLWFNDLMGFVYSYIRDEEAARDIVHDVYMTIWNNRHHLDTSWSLKSYLYTLARNYALNFIRHQKVIAGNEEEIARSMDVWQDEIEDYDITMARLRVKLGELPEKQREVLMKCFVEGKTYKLVAEELAISLNTVKTHIKRALKFLRDELHEDIVLLFLMRNK